MDQPLRLDRFERLPLAWRASVGDGLAAAIDQVAAGAPPSHRFLRYQWYAAALAAYGGSARTIVVASEAGPAIALPLVGVGPAWLRAAAVPGSYWPFRSFPAATDEPAAWTALADRLADTVTALRIGPVEDDDKSLGLLAAAARRRGWAVLPRTVGRSYVLDIAAQRAVAPWPRNSTLKKNRFHEKHLAAYGALAWEQAERWDDATFDTLAKVERASWIATRTDGRDAKFRADGHGRFWREAARDPVLAGMFHAAVLRVAGDPVAFSFDIDCPPVSYAVANSYDPAFSRHSPGKLLAYRNLAAAAERGIERVDWGCGDSGYKQTMGAADGPMIRDWLLLRPGLPALAGRILRAGWR